MLTDENNISKVSLSSGQQSTKENIKSHTLVYGLIIIMDYLLLFINHIIFILLVMEL